MLTTTPYTDSEDEEKHQKIRLQGSKTQPQPKDRKFSHFRLRRKPRDEYKSSKDLGAFIKRIERVSNLQKNLTAPWDASDAEGLFRRICRLENQDSASLLPQGNARPRKSGADPVDSLFDLKTGIWKDSLVTEEDMILSESRYTSNPLKVRDVPSGIDQESQYIGELSVSSLTLVFA